MTTETNTAKFRVHAVGYYDVDLTKLEEQYKTDDVVEASQIDQNSYRDNPAMLFDLFSNEFPEVYVQVFDPGGQMFTDEFLQEVIQLVRVEDWEFHINHEGDRDRRVHVKLVGTDGRNQRHSLDGYGITMGFALRDVREQLRNLIGR